MTSGLVNVSAVLQSGEYKREYTYTNETGGYNDTTGEWESIVSVSTPASGSIQPLLDEDLQELIEWGIGGARILSAIRIITAEDLLVAENGDPTSTTGSTVEYDGLFWKVIDNEDYSEHGHNEFVAVRIDNISKV